MEINCAASHSVIPTAGFLQVASHATGAFTMKCEINVSRQGKKKSHGKSIQPWCFAGGIMRACGGEMIDRGRRMGRMGRLRASEADREGGDRQVILVADS